MHKCINGSKLKHIRIKSGKKHPMLYLILPWLQAAHTIVGITTIPMKVEDENKISSFKDYYPVSLVLP